MKLPAIGIDRRLDLEWLDAVAARVAAGDSEAELRDFLFQLLDGVVAGGTKRGTACHKTVGVLAGAWFNVPPEVEGLRDRSARLVGALDASQRLGLHWTMLMAAYPFFADVATNVGRLLALQGNLALTQLTRRMREVWGDRSTMTRAAQRIVRSMVQWAVLTDSDTRGIYLRSSRTISVRSAVGELLVEALLIRSGSPGIPVDQAIRHPSFFPFQVELSAHQLRQSERFDVHRQGLDLDVVSLATMASSPEARWAVRAPS